jgi:hypothetical protein
MKWNGKWNRNSIPNAEFNQEWRDPTLILSERGQHVTKTSTTRWHPQSSKKSQKNNLSRFHGIKIIIKLLRKLSKKCQTFHVSLASGIIKQTNTNQQKSSKIKNQVNKVKFSTIKAKHEKS